MIGWLRRLLKRKPTPLVYIPIPICEATASRCRCSKPDGHLERGDKVHECEPTECTGAWIGDPEADDESFFIVRLPFPINPFGEGD